jgi:hypothetical protein
VVERWWSVRAEEVIFMKIQVRKVEQTRLTLCDEPDSWCYTDS